MKIPKKPVYSQRVRSAWLRKRFWPFQVSVIHPTRRWRISSGVYDTFGEGATFEEAVDDAITNERLRKRGCAMRSQCVITEIPEPKARQMVRAAEAMLKALTGETSCKRVCR